MRRGTIVDKSVLPKHRPERVEVFEKQVHKIVQEVLVTGSSRTDMVKIECLLYSRGHLAPETRTRRRVRGCFRKIKRKVDEVINHCTLGLMGIGHANTRSLLGTIRIVHRIRGLRLCGWRYRPWRRVWLRFSIGFGNVGFTGSFRYRVQVRPPIYQEWLVGVS